MIFSLESLDPKTKFFIFDTGRIEHGDVEFEIYSWNKHRYNLVSPGDLFVYRKPQKVSETNKFYFFGAGQIETIQELKPGSPNFKQLGDLEARISNPIIFNKSVFQDEIVPSDLHDTRKEKKDNWEHFFNNYGMNQINADVFLFLLNRGLGNKKKTDEETNKLRIRVHKNINSGNFEVTDSEATVKTRGKYQRIFREDIILPNYNHQCAITGIRKLPLLRAAHIIRWADNKKTRIDPRNGICLSVLADACFENGYITIDSDYIVRVSEEAREDPALYSDISRYDGSKIYLPKLEKHQPKKEFLLEHQNRKRQSKKF